MIRWTLKHYLTRQALQVQESMQDPLAAQTRAFLRLRRLLQGGELAARSGFSRCKTLEDCRYLPVSDSESMKELFQRARDGGVAASPIFGRSRIVGFGRTSGSSGEPKDIPLNQSYLRSLDRSLARMTGSHFYVSGEWQNLLRGRQIMLGSRLLIGDSPTGLPINDISGLIQTRVPRFLRKDYLPRHEDLGIQDWPRKAELILDQAHGQKVVSMIGIPALGMDLVRRALIRYKVAHLDQVWPSLRYFIYGGVPLSREQKAEIERLWFGRTGRLSFIETYTATEGPLAFTYDPRDEGMVLNSLENLYLFYPEKSLGDPPLFAHEIEEGQTYSIHITTPGGLINYRMGDRVRVLSRRPLRIRVLGREKDELSMTGEKITLEQLDLALDAAGLERLRSASSWPVVWIGHQEKPHLVWGMPASEAGTRLPDSTGARLDEALCRLNTLYSEAFQQEKVIGGSRVVEIPLSMFRGYIEARLGIGQAKPKRLFNSQSEFESAYLTRAERAEAGSAGS